MAEENNEAQAGTETERKRTRVRKFLLGALKVAAMVFFLLLLPVAVGVATGAALAFMRTVPSVAEIRQNITPPSTKIYANDDTLIGELKIQKGEYVPLRKMPPDLLNAVVSVEDSRFWEHSGVDYTAIMRAAIKDIMKRQLKEGGSTITQQLAKIAFLTPEKTFKRKLREFVLAHRIERELTKEEILELYLNRVYLGHGAYGVEMAAKEYFGKSVKDLTLPECAIISGLLKAPSTFSPISNFKRSKERQMLVLRRMEEEEYINQRQRLEAERTGIVLSKSLTDGKNVNYFIEYVKKQLLEMYDEETVYKSGMKVYTTLDRHAQQSAQESVQEGLRDFDKRRGWRGPIAHKDLEVEKLSGSSALVSTVPPSRGEIVSGVVMKVGKDEALVKADALVGKLRKEDADWAKHIYDPKAEEPIILENFNLTKIIRQGDVIKVKVKSIDGEKVAFSLEQVPEAQAALVAIETHSGFIRAIVGGYDYSLSEFNRALYAQRQAGSAFKPVIYATALKNGFTPASVIVDEEVTFETNPEQGMVIVKTREEMEKELREEVAMLNEKGGGPQDGEENEEVDRWTPSNYDQQYKGATTLRDALAYSRNVITAKLVDQIGIQRLFNFARSIGIENDMPRDLTISLGTLSISPLELTISYGSFANGGMRMDPIAIKYVTDRRGKVIFNNEPRGRRVLDEQTSFLITSMLKDVVNYGTGWRARALRRPVAGKTGTTNDYRDAWFVGYTADMISGVWVGYDDMKPLGKGETGSKAAAPIWVSFMKQAAMDTEPRDFPRPEGITTRLIDPKTGLLANKWTENAVLEYFIEGTEPEEYTDSIWQTNEPTNLIF